MRLRDVSVGDTVFYGRPNQLAAGNGMQAKIVAYGHYTVTQQPCGRTITPIPGGTARASFILQVPKKQADKHAYLYLDTDTNDARYIRVSEGRYLMEPTEHDVLRKSREALELEHEAYVERGHELSQRIQERAQKILAGVGVPPELVVSGVYRRWGSGSDMKWAARVDMDRAATDAILQRDSGLQTLLQEYQRWSDQPDPGRECAT